SCSANWSERWPPGPDPRDTTARRQGGGSARQPLDGSLTHHREVIGMRIRYFVVDATGQLRKAAQEAVRGLWEGRRRAETLGCPAGNELRLVSVVCDDSLLPQRVYLLRLPLTGGEFTPESRLTLQLHTRPDCVTPGELAVHHTQGWPPDFY